METSKSSENTFKQNQDFKTEGKVLEARRTRGGRRRSESVSDLEAEETKGFIDLGFVFTEEDLNSELPEILPGLRTFLHREEQSKTDSSVPRPYLSEAWELHSNKKDSIVLDLRMAKICSETNMKDCLKWWARSVASSLK
ncbi:uncharacterized protein LOC103840505 [Brassica rapa]|uniref:Uncharacterized protein n=1 Tax=Brassica campestris TaxID=3711 RepID=M4EU17_BRACM|nr:uncharacterized protein LOC103840505 [Brassica rapa]